MLELTTTFTPADGSSPRTITLRVSDARPDPDGFTWSVAVDVLGFKYDDSVRLKQVDWAAFTLKEPAGERFLVGYGLDYAERYRGLPYIGTIPRPDKPGEGRTISIASGS